MTKKSWDPATCQLPHKTKAMSMFPVTCVYGHSYTFPQLQHPWDATGTWSTMADTNCWREVESVSPVCPG